MQQDSDEYNEEPVSIHDENSNASNIQTYAVVSALIPKFIWLSLIMWIKVVPPRMYLFLNETRGIRNSW